MTTYPGVYIEEDATPSLIESADSPKLIRHFVAQAAPDANRTCWLTLSSTRIEEGLP
jgi:hypothetical protein